MTRVLTLVATGVVNAALALPLTPPWRTKAFLLHLPDGSTARGHRHDRQHGVPRLAARRRHLALDLRTGEGEVVSQGPGTPCRPRGHPRPAVGGRRTDGQRALRRPAHREDIGDGPTDLRRRSSTTSWPWSRPRGSPTRCSRSCTAYALGRRGHHAAAHRRVGRPRASTPTASSERPTATRCSSSTPRTARSIASTRTPASPPRSTAAPG